MTTFPPLRSADFDDRRPLKRHEPKPCPICYNPMRDDGCPKHGLPDAPKPERIRSRDGRARPAYTRVERMADEIVQRNKDGESIIEIAETVWEDLGYSNVLTAANQIRRYMRREGIEIHLYRRRPPTGVARPR